MTTGGKKTRLAAGVAILVLAGVIAVLLIPGKRPPVPELEIRFVALTNSPAGHIFATFSITNPHARTVWFTPGYLQLRSASGWRETTGRPIFGTDGRIAANGLTNFSLRVDITTNSYWRVPFQTVFWPTGIEHWREVLKVNWRTYSQSGKLAGWSVGYSLRYATNYSEEFKVPYGF